MLMALDRFQFSISTAAYEQLQQFASIRLASIPLLGGGEVLQVVGINHDVIRLTGTVHPQITRQFGGPGGTRSIDDLRDLLHDGLPLILQSADGFSLGYWIIIELNSVNSNYLGSTPRIQQFQITLKYYGENAQ